jgi:enamine deaminase RidA (YjgF/YER057c/UK114 family)
VKGQHVSSGGPWEERVGYSRAIRRGDRIWVSGTTGTRPDGSVPAGAGAQAALALDTIVAALEELGASAEDVVVVRSYVLNIGGDWEEVAAALRARFASVRPAMAMVEVRRLMLPEHLVEIEVEAVVGG